jgi:Tol biopolymer transport system component
VSVASDGSPANETNGALSLSADGQLVAFESGATNLDARCTLPNFRHVFVRDLQAGTTACVSVGAGGTEADGGSFTPVLSADGRLVAFESTASNLISGDDTTGFRHIFVHDRLAGTTTRATVAGVPVATPTLLFGLSADGRFVAFISADESTEPCVCVRDLVAGRPPSPRFS